MELLHIEYRIYNFKNSNKIRQIGFEPVLKTHN